MKCKVCETPIKEGRSFCSIGCYNKTVKWTDEKRKKHAKRMCKAMTEASIKRFGSDEYRERVCPKCQKAFTVWTGRNGKSGRIFCSNLCSRGRAKSSETREKIRRSLNANRPPFSKTVPCKHCGEEFTTNKKKKTFCNVSCANRFRMNLPENKKKYREIMKKTASEINTRSKNEIFFSEMCRLYFNSVKTNAPVFNGWDADVIIEDERLAVLWNGNWHYMKLRSGHSVEQIKNRDLLKLKEIKRCGYTPYIIRDPRGFNPLFVKFQFKILLEYLENIDLCYVGPAGVEPTTEKL